MADLAVAALARPEAVTESTYYSPERQDPTDSLTTELVELFNKPAKAYS
jgi:hypothetical protein